MILQDLTSLYCSRSCNPRGIMATDNVPVMFHRLFSQSGAFICAPQPIRSLVRAPFKIGRNYGNAVDILRSANITNYHGRHTSELFFYQKISIISTLTFTVFTATRMVPSWPQISSASAFQTLPKFPSPRTVCSLSRDLGNSHTEPSMSTGLPLLSEAWNNENRFQYTDFAIK